MKLENKPLFCGKETIRLNQSFYDLPFVKEVVGENLDEEQVEIMNNFHCNAVHGDHVVTVPDEAVIHGSSDRTDIELWTL